MKEYHRWLLEYNSYYRGLEQVNRDRFLDRVLQFIDGKKFEYVRVQPDPVIPLLVSAAAIQVSFGLEDFSFDFFEYIYIANTSYHWRGNPSVYEGHVNRKGIFLSWEHFVQGYRDYTDGHNVGIHELAHALTYTTQYGDSLHDRRFRKRFRKFVRVAAPVFENLKNGGVGFLPPQAAGNFHEFWAVSMEAFFERALVFRVAEPALYDAFCALLNQDPLELTRMWVNDVS